jgi:homoserine O-succinyltransferase
MPLTVQKNLPAVEALKKENISVSEVERGHYGLHDTHLLVLNLMPKKIETETDLARLLSNTVLPVSLSFLKIKNHISKNTPAEHINEFYFDIDEAVNHHFDGMIVTGAPVELLPFEDVRYWEELKGIFNWARSNVRSVMYICWAAQAALYHFHGIPKYSLQKKMFGVFSHTVSEPQLPIFRGFDDEFFVPHSRHTEVRKDDILRNPDLSLISESNDAGVYIVMSREGREFYVTGHSEYAPDTLDGEYKRDMSKGLPIAVPENYYRNNNPEEGVIDRWRSHANLLFANWLNYYVHDPNRTN